MEESVMDYYPGVQPPQGLYDPKHEHDACGVGFVVDMKGRKSHKNVHDALLILEYAVGKGI